MDSLQLYLALAGMGFRRMFAYRAATLAGLATNFFFGAIRAFVFIALFAQVGNAPVAGLGVREAVTYAALTQALIGPVRIWGSYEIMQTIRTGQIASDLTKPLDFFGFWLAQEIGRAAFEAAARGLPIMLAYGLVFDLVWPAGAGRWLVFGLSVALAVVISFGWRFILNVTAFWTTDAYGVSRMAYLGVLLLTGLTVPLAFFPDGVREVVRLLPFGAFMNTPAEIYLGVVSGPSLGAALGVQVAWAIGLAVVGRALYGRGVRRLVVQGG